ncbi:MAG: hypothetical protein GXX85_01775 [Ignavibacteria bacterium]|nr:hypothetical protein [Ignavibacteria bacterium]
MVISRVISDAGSYSASGVIKSSDARSNNDSAIGAISDEQAKFKEKPDPLIRAIVDPEFAEKSKDSLEYREQKKGIYVNMVL